MTNKSTNEESWEAEFRERFKNHWHTCISKFLPIPEAQMNKIVDFIRQKISEAEEKEYQRGREEKGDEACKIVTKEINKFKVAFVKDIELIKEEAKQKAYQQCKEEIIAYISKIQGTGNWNRIKEQIINYLNQ